MKGFADDLIAICRSFGMFEREAVCCGTVSVPQCVVLQHLADADSDVSGIAQLLGVTNGAATRLVDGLEARGFVRRERSDQDRRRVEVALTATGRAEAERLAKATANAIAAVLGRIPKRKRVQVREAVTLVRAAVEGTRTELTGCCAPAAERRQRSG